MYNLPEWPTKPSTWSEETIQLLLEGCLTPTPDVTLADFLLKSEKVPIKFPIESMRCKNLKYSVVKEVLEKNINSAYPLIHENVLPLYAQFILHKRKYGSASEKQLYKNMTILSFIERVLTKRALMFAGKFDSYMLMNGTRAARNWELIGKDDKSNETLEDCLSYDEIKLSVFLSVSSYSYFINNGTRQNMGKVSQIRDNIQARLMKVGVMEYEEMVITKAQNDVKNGYGATSNESLHSVFASFYEEPCFTYEQTLNQKENEVQRFTDVGEDEYFDNVVYAKRIGLSIDTLLLEANHRAKEKTQQRISTLLELALELGNVRLIKKKFLWRHSQTG